MSTIDRRIVQMQFDNQGFNTKVEQTINSMKRLSESLKMKTPSNSIANLDREIKNTTSSGLGALGRGVDDVASKFTAMGAVATTALVNITNSAINTGKRMFSALTIDPITSGFSEYETKMDSIQTILTNTAHQNTTLDDVTKTLQELNTYADQTIYNFAEMTRNIGTFTAAGVDLDTSTAAIKGIANLAAASGSSSAQASTAMYQLSQALAAGKVSLQDWNSVVNAGMGGKLFQDALIRTSEKMGTGAEAAIKKYGSFRESLTEGAWLTTDVLTETLKQISGAYTEADLVAQGYTKSQAREIVKLAKNATAAATEVKTVTQLFDTMKESVGSGWAQSWEYIIGDKDQATKTLTAISDGFNNIIGPSTDARNEMLKFWNEAGGRDDVISGLSNIIGSVGKGLSAIGEAFKNVFPPMTGEKLVELSKGFKDLTEKFKMSDETASKIKNTFEGFFSVINLVKNAIGVLVKSMSPLAVVVGGIAKVFLAVASGIGTFLSKLNEAATTSDVFGKLSSTLDTFYGKISEALDLIAGGISNIFKKIGDADFSGLFNTLEKVTSGLTGGLGDLFSNIGKAIGKIDFNAIFAIINGILTGGVLKTIQTLMDSINGTFKSFSGVTKGITSCLDAVKESLEAYQNSLNAGTLLKIAAAVGLLAVSLALLGTLDAESIENSLTGVTVLFLELIAAMAVLIKVIGGKKIPMLMTISTTMITMAVAINILAIAVKSLSELSWEELTKGLAGVAGSMTILIGGVKLLDGSSRRMKSTAKSILILSGAVLILSQAVKQLGSMDYMSLIKGLVSMGVMLAELVVFMKLIDGTKMSVTSAAGILILSGALMILSTAVESFAKMDTNQLIKGLTAVGVSLAEILAFSKLIGNPAGLVLASAGLITLSIALNIMSGAIKSMGSMSWESIGKGLLGIAGSLGIITAAVKMMPKASLLTTSVGIGAMAVSLMVLSSALKSFGSMSWNELGVGLAGLASSLALLAVAMKLMSSGIKGAVACTIFAAAISILAPQLILLSQIDLMGLGIALGVLAGTFTIFGIAALVLKPLVPVMISLAGAFALLSLSCLALAGSVALLGTGLTLIAAAGSAAGFALIEIIRQLLGLLPTLGTKLGQMFTNLAKVLGENIPVFMEAISKFIQSICQLLLDNLPLITETIFQLVISLLQVLEKSLPQFVDVAVKVILALAEGLESNVEKIVTVVVNIVIKIINCLSEQVGKFVQAGIDFAISLINGLADGIRNNDELVFDAVGNLLSAIVEALLTGMQGLLDKFIEIGRMIIKGLIDGMWSMIEGVISMIGDIAQGLIDGMCEFLGIHSPSTVFFDIGKNVVQGLINGIGSLVSSAITKIQTTAKSLINKAKSLLNINTLKKVGKDLLQGLINGIGSLVSTVVSKIQTAAKSMIKKAKELLNLETLKKVGKDLIQGLISGIGTKISSAVKSISDIASKIKNKAKGLLNLGTLKSAGKNVVQGLINGISSKVSSAVKSIKDMGQKVIDAGLKKLGINSPSKVFESIGNYTVMGFVKGVRNNISTAKSSVENMGDKVVSTMNSVVSKISEALNGDLDTNPTITPVVDLSEVKKGSSYIGSLLSSNSGSVSLATAGAGVMSNSISGLQNGIKYGDNEVVKAIKDLKNTISNNDNTSYNVNGITYDDGSNISKAVETLVRAAKIERRV